MDFVIASAAKLIRYVGNACLLSFYCFSYLCLSLVGVFIHPPPSIVANGTDPPLTETYEQWRAHQTASDKVSATDEWVKEDYDPSYDSSTLRVLKSKFEGCRQSGDLRTMFRQFREQSSRNVCRILSSALYKRSTIQTKKLIHDYIREVRRCIKYTVDTDFRHVNTSLSTQERRQIVSDMTRILGRTTLVLQGGALHSMCHLGVVRALHRRRLLPWIITGTGTGALVAALVGSTPEDRLAEVLEGNTINLDAFTRARERQSINAESSDVRRWLLGLARRCRRFADTGHFFDIGVVSACAEENLGDITFEEARVLSGRILNITIAMPTVAGIPGLLNYITAPHVLIRTAVAASLATSKSLYAPADLLCKDDTGAISRYIAVDASSHRTRLAATSRSPLERIGELFNVNHYIISQTRPYIGPFLRLQNWTERTRIMSIPYMLIASEVLHWLDSMKYVGLLPVFLQRIMIDEMIPSSAPWAKFVIVPRLSLHDYLGVFDLPTPQKIRYLANQGEKSVWPMLCQIKVRCCIEMELEIASQSEHRLPAAQHDANG